MHFLVDAQLPPALARLLADRGHVAEHVADCGLEHASDRAVWAHAGDSHACIITKDEDFAVYRMMQAGGPAVVWVRLGNTSKRQLLVWFDALLPSMIAALERGEALIEVT